jgi:hypothetical protein
MDFRSGLSECLYDSPTASGLGTLERCLLLPGRRRRVFTPTQERLMRRGIVGKIAAHLAERSHETLHVVECLDAQGSVDQVA